MPVDIYSYRLFWLISTFDVVYMQQKILDIIQLLIAYAKLCRITFK